MTKTRTLLRISLLVAGLLLCAPNLFAQGQNCDLPAGSGGTISPTSSTAIIGFLSPNLNFTGESSGLDLVQFVFTNPNDLVFDDFSGSTGPRILLANETGRLDPAADLGLVRGDEFCVFSWSFSLSVLQDQVDTLFNSSFSGVPCCLFAEATQGVDVCSLLIDSDIDEGSDLEDFNDIVEFAVAYGIQGTFPSIQFLVDSFINIVPLGSPCTPGRRMCWATSNTACFTVDTGTVMGIGSVEGLSSAAPYLSDLQAGPNPASDFYQIGFNSSWSGQAQLHIIDATGRIVAQQPADLFLGNNQLPLNLAGYPAGYYAIRLITPQWSTALRVLRN
ncbi:MAG: T9SS type A sorting domain-containing protein [Bacteroidetes bacterium]|nr:T9SS type A sorting domain-containing protein [Bacteroidota bacterium]